MCFIIADPDVTRVKGKLEKNLITLVWVWIHTLNSVTRPEGSSHVNLVIWELE